MKKKIIIALILIIIGVSITYVVLNYNKENIDNTENTNNTEKTETPTPTSPSSPKPTPTPITNVEEMNAQEKSIFNSKFNIYLGKDVNASNVKRLIAVIKHSNENTAIRKVDLTINGEVATDSSKINDSSTYTVTFEYDDNKLICKAIVVENK